MTSSDDRPVRRQRRRSQDVQARGPFRPYDAKEVVNNIGRHVASVCSRPLAANTMTREALVSPVDNLCGEAVVLHVALNETIRLYVRGAFLLTQLLSSYAWTMSTLLSLNDAAHCWSVGEEWGALFIGERAARDAVTCAANAAYIVEHVLVPIWKRKCRPLDIDSRIALTHTCGIDIGDVSVIPLRTGSTICIGKPVSNARLLATTADAGHSIFTTDRCLAVLPRDLRRASLTRLRWSRATGTRLKSDEKIWQTRIQIPPELRTDREPQR